MRLYLVRHGKAEQESPTGRDEDRPLAARGVLQAEWLAEMISRYPPRHRPSIMLASPALRAKDTATIVQRALACPLHLTDALRIGEPLEDVIHLARATGAELSDDSSIMLIGHNPMLEALVGMLVPGCAESDCTMHTGEAIVIEFATSKLEAPGRIVGRLRSPE